MNRRNLTWKMNWYRQSELEGALLLGRLVAGVEDGDFAEKLTKHAADEARHSQMWAEAIREAGLGHVRIFRSYQSLYRDHGGTPATMVEALAFTQVFERRVHRTFTAEVKDATLPAVVRETYAVMIEDEKDHLGWVAEWLRSQSGARECLDHYHAIDLAVYEELRPNQDQLYSIEGLGQEITNEPVSA